MIESNVFTGQLMKLKIVPTGLEGLGGDAEACATVDHSVAITIPVARYYGRRDAIFNGRESKVSLDNRPGLKAVAGSPSESTKTEVMAIKYTDLYGRA